MRRAGFLLDLGRCVGCGACVLACRLAHGRDAEAPWRRVLALNLRRAGGGPTWFLSLACHHCDDPACLRGCPSQAYEQRPDGIVLHRAERCLGCRYCEMACPFGAPTFDPASGLESKCHFCADRVDAGGGPACVAACPTGALRSRLHEDDPADAERELPGFCDSAGCGPNVRLRPPRGTLRRERLQALRKRLER